MTAVEAWVDHDVRIRYLDNHGSDGHPVVFVPGIVDSADDYHALLDLFLPRRAVVIELRGRGRSSWPAGPDADFSAPAHADDIDAVIGHLGFACFHLMTFSRGTTYALEVLLRDDSRALSLSIGDYWAREHRVDPAFTDEYMKGRFRGVLLVDRIAVDVVRGVFAQSRDRDLLPAVASTGVPLLVATGTEKGRIIGDTEIDEYRRAVPGVTVVTLAGSAHDLFNPDRTAYPSAVRGFIALHDHTRA